MTKDALVMGDETDMSSPQVFSISPVGEKRVFTICRSEIRRRQRAFTVLVVSSLSALAVGSLSFAIRQPFVWVSTMSALSFFLAVARWLTLRWLRRLEHVRYRLDAEELQFLSGNVVRRCILKDVTRIYVKRTTSATIREIRIRCGKNSQLFISGIQEFEFFRQALMARCQGAVTVEWREPIDFDHPLFYFFFGLVVGGFGAVTFHVMAGFDAVDLRIFALFIALVELPLGLLLLLKKPLTIRLGLRARRAEVVFGMVVVAFGVWMVGVAWLGTG